MRFKKIGVHIEVDWHGNWAAHSFDRDRHPSIRHQGPWRESPNAALAALRSLDRELSELLDAPDGESP